MQTLENGMTLLDAFPFDSSPNLVYTNQGYPRGDRAVDAWTMRSAFRQFFSTGVFGTPADAFQISKGTGLSVVIQPGMCVIEGGMGGISEKSGPLTLTLGTGPAQGKTPYGIMLRYDDNSDVRGITVYAKKGTPGDNPKPPEPDTESANVHELRLGYVIVPNGASDLSSATVTNEKGLEACPYAAPFEEIDLSEVVTDAKNQAQTEVDAFLVYAKTYYDLVASALDGTTAGELQAQIDAITPAGLVDDVTLEQSSSGKMQVKTGGVSTSQLADESVTHDKLDKGMQALVPGSIGATGTILKSDGKSAKWVEQSLDLVKLWEGTWTQGSIKVPGVSEYAAIVVTTRTGSKVIAMRGDDAYYGASGHFGSSHDYGACSVFFSVSGDTLSATDASSSGQYTQAAAIRIYRDASSNTMNGYKESITKIEGWLK